jgi:hypothetical protein
VTGREGRSEIFIFEQQLGICGAFCAQLIHPEITNTRNDMTIDIGFCSNHEMFL